MWHLDAEKRQKRKDAPVKKNQEFLILIFFFFNFLIQGGQEDKIPRVFCCGVWLELAVFSLIWFKEGFGIKNRMSAWFCCKR